VSLLQGELKKPDAAMTTLNELIAKTPGQWQGYNLRGQLHASLQQLDLAIEDFDQAMMVDPKAPEPQLNKVTILIAQKKTEEALAILNGIIKQYPNALLPIEMRMQLYQALGKNKEALADLTKIQELKKTK
jgi:predicted Zn-dependent protease